jgi:hypothetical protein
MDEAGNLPGPVERDPAWRAMKVDPIAVLRTE